MRSLSALWTALLLIALGACATPPPPAPPPEPSCEPELAAVKSANRERTALLEREVQRLEVELDEAEQALGAVESGLRGTKSRADAVSGLAEARIEVERASRQTRWRPQALESAGAKLSESERQLEIGKYAAAIFFSSRAARIADELIEESEWAAAHPKARFVKAHRVNLRTGPSLDERVKQVLPRGTPVLPESEAGDWLLVRTAGGRVGWIHATLVR